MGPETGIPPPPPGRNMGLERDWVTPSNEKGHGTRDWGPPPQKGHGTISWKCYGIEMG